VVLEADQRAAIARVELALEHDVSDHPHAAGLGHEVDQADAGHLGALVAAVAVPQQLVAPAHGQHARAVGNRRCKVGCVAGEIARDQHLIAVLTPAEVIEVGAGEGVTHAHRHHLEWDAAPSAAAVEHSDVAAVSVDIQVLGVEMADRDPAHAASSQKGRTSPRCSSRPRSSSIAV
jgi:hypothetical protein